MKQLMNIVLHAILYSGFFMSGVLAQVPHNYGDDVFDRIVRAVNRDVPSPPQLQWVNGSRDVAVTYADGRIEVDYQLLNKMRAFGADSSNALAHILTHEIMHYYLDHFWAGQFSLPYANSEWGKELQHIDADTLQMQYYETQADLYAIFYATTAGYSTLHVADRVLDSIYAWYKLPYKMERYPTLDARKEIARSAARDIQSLLPMYETGKWMLLLGMNSSGAEQLTYLKGASLAFEHIIDNNIRTEEMYNNIAVVHIIQAISFMNDTLAALTWPLIMESGSVLYDASSTRGQSVALPEEAARHLAEAKVFLENALELNPEYAPALSNLCVTFLLQGKFGSYADTYDMLEAGRHPEWLFDELDAFMHFLKGRKEEAQSALAAAANKGSWSAKQNAAVMAGNLQAGQMQIPDLSEITEMVNGQLLPDYFYQVSGMDGSRMDEKSQGLLLFADTLDTYRIFEVKLKFSDKAFRTLKLVETIPGLDVSSDTGLKTGQGMDKVLQLYGSEYRVNRTTLGEICYFPKQHLLVKLDTNNKVSGWAYFWAM
jgi:hypothetical protein